MSSSIQEEKGNPISTLKVQAEKLNFEILKAQAVSKEGRDEIDCGFTTFKDIDRMDFVINGKNIDKTFTKALINREKKEFDKIWEEYCKGPKIPSDKKTDQYKEEVEKFYSIGKGHAHLLPKKEGGNYRPFAKEVFKEMFKYAKARVPSDLILEHVFKLKNELICEA